MRHNVAALVLARAAAQPEQIALVLPRRFGADGVHEETVVRYHELAARIAELQVALADAGIEAGDRVMVAVPLSTDLYALVLALLASGAAAVLCDAGMGRAKLSAALAQARVKAVVGARALVRLWPLLPPLWRAGRFALDGAAPGVRGLATAPSLPRPALARNADHEALITFTSGSTGRPKGADRSHGILMAQHRALAAHVPHQPGAIDMPCFPVVVLHNLCLGLTTVLPPVDLAAPARVAPPAVLAQIERWGVTSLSGAPAYLDRIAGFMLDSGRRAPTVRELVVGGAPVSRALAARLRAAFPTAAAHVLYGSTEAEPISSATLEEVLASGGAGHLVGRPAAEVELALVELPAGAQLGEAGIEPYRVAPGQLGEVVVRGAHVIRRYLDPRATRQHKLPAPDGTVWHRTGDVGRLDQAGRLSLTGRLPDLVPTRLGVLEPLAVEEPLADLPGLRRAALVAHAGAPSGELVLELLPGALPGPCVAGVHARAAELGIAGLAVRVVGRIPMDGRHGSKIDRPALRKALGRRRSHVQ